MSRRSHPVARAVDEISAALATLGYRETLSPQVEDVANNFERLNIAPGHPERDPGRAFYLRAAGLEPRLLRTHISSMHPRLLAAGRPPLRAFSAGRVFRPESRDARHSPVFHQVEALRVERGLGLADLKGTLCALLRRLFGRRARLRLRPSYFPYTAPSLEFDVACRCRAGCALCGGTGWCELGGAGLLRPEVLRRSGCPAGFDAMAFAVGVERCAMLREGLPDIRVLYAERQDPR